MGKTNYLELTNRVLGRVDLPVITDVSTVNGSAQIISNYINEAQNALYVEDTWVSLIASRTFKSSVYTAATISFSDSNPDTIDDSANGLGGFSAGMTVIVGGSTSNNGVYVVDTATAGSLTLQATDELVAEGAGASVTIIAMTYPVASNFASNMDMVDVTNNRALSEDFVRSFDFSDPDFDRTGTPSFFTIEGDFYRFYEIPAGTYTFRETYYKTPAILTANTDTSDLPLECENCIIEYAYARFQEYNRAFEVADKAMIQYRKSLARARATNKSKLKRTRRVSTDGGFVTDRTPPKLPSNYPAN